MPRDIARARAEQEDLAQARRESDAKTLSERGDEAVAWACIAIVEIARAARDRDDLARRLEGDLPVSLRTRWERIRQR